MAKIGATMTPSDNLRDTRDTIDTEDIPELSTLFQADDECICEFGDVVLVINDGFHPVLKVQVSSCVLAMSSKVFKVLFSERFIEGQNAKGRCAAAPREIGLEDTPVPMRQMLQLLHLQPVEDLDTAIALLNFALVVDKYDCAANLRLQADALLQMQHESKIEWGVPQYNYQQLLAAAFLLDQPRHFRQFGHRLVVTSRTLLQADDFSQRALEILPEKLLHSLLHQQNLARHEVAVQVGCLIADFRKSCIAAGRETLLVELMDELCSREFLFPHRYSWSPEFTSDMFQRIKLPVISLTDPIRKPQPYAGAWLGSGDACDDAGHAISMTERSRHRATTGSLTSDTMSAEFIFIDAPTQRSLKERAAKFLDLCSGVCLDCLKDQDCREDHWPGETGHGGVLSWDLPGPSLESVTDPDEW